MPVNHSTCAPFFVNPTIIFGFDFNLSYGIKNYGTIGSSLECIIKTGTLTSFI